MANDLTRGEQTQLKLGTLASELLPMVVANPSSAYAYGLHKTMVQKHGSDYASASDVSRALELLVQHGALTVNTDTPTPRVYYKPTWLATYEIGLAQRMAQQATPTQQAA